MRIKEIQFRLLRAQFNRTLETLAVLYHISLLYFTPLFCLIWLCLLFTKYYHLSVLYLLWVLYDRNTSIRSQRQSKTYRRWGLWRHFRNYFPITVVKTADLDPNKNYIIGYHPHGIITLGAYCCFGTDMANFPELFPGITPYAMIMKILLWLPLLRDHALMTGGRTASAECIKWLLTKAGKGNALMLVIGGAEESLFAHPGTSTLILKKRKGFIRLALKHGASLVPSYSFGENDLYSQWPNPPGSFVRKFQDKCKSMFGYTLPLFYGTGFLPKMPGFMPYRKPVNIVIGKPIDIEKIDEPTNEDIDRVHQIYIEKLTELFEEHKHKYAPDLKLDII